MQIVLVLYLMLFEMSASTQYNEDDLNFVCGLWSVLTISFANTANP